MKAAYFLVALWIFFGFVPSDAQRELNFSIECTQRTGHIRTVIWVHSVSELDNIITLHLLDDRQCMNWQAGEVIDLKTRTMVNWGNGPVMRPGFVRCVVSKKLENCIVLKRTPVDR